VIVGGLGYVYAAYGIVWTGIVAYGASLIWRERRAVPIVSKDRL
jgi:CcmD family protein